MSVKAARSVSLERTNNKLVFSISSSSRAANKLGKSPDKINSKNNQVTK